MIGEAREFLYLSTFYIEYDRYGIQLLDTLIDAQRRGVSVNLLVDGFGQTLGGVLMTVEARRSLSAKDMVLPAPMSRHTTPGSRPQTRIRPAPACSEPSQGSSPPMMPASALREVSDGASSLFTAANRWQLNCPIARVPRCVVRVSILCKTFDRDICA